MFHIPTFNFVVFKRQKHLKKKKTSVLMGKISKNAICDINNKVGAQGRVTGERPEFENTFRPNHMTDHT